MLGISDLIEQGHMEPIQVYCISLNRFGEIVGYFEDDHGDYVMVMLYECHLHDKPTKGDLSTAAEVPLSDVVEMGKPLVNAV